MNLLKIEYERACSCVSDINEHLPTLYALAKSCISVTEFGVRSGVSTRAFLYAKTRLRSYDIQLNNEVEGLFSYARCVQHLDVEYIQGDTTVIDIEPTDLLFIDTLHTYEQLKTELFRHSHAVRHYIVLHDTVSYGYESEDGSKPGLIAAIAEFLNENRVFWEIKQKYLNNNGLMVLERCKP